MLTEFQAKKWTHLFNLYDVDGSGAVTKEDFVLKGQTVAKLLDIEPSSASYEKMSQEVMADWEHLQKDVDLNNDGKISLDEWLTHGYNRINNPDMYETVKKEVDAIFELFDQNKDGLMSREEYSTLLKAWNVSDEGIEFSCSKVGLGLNDTLSKDQLVQLVEQFHKSDDPDAVGNYFFGKF